MDIIPNHELPAAVVAELSALGPRYVLARNVADRPASVQRVPAWYALRGRPCAEPAASEQWERVEVDADTYPALAAWLDADDRATEEWARQERDAERTAELREIEDDAREESAALFEAHVAHWTERGRTRAEAVDLANRWATPADAQRALVAAWRESRRTVRGRGVSA